MTDQAMLDVLVRLPVPACLDALSRTVFSIALQDHRPVTIHVVCPTLQSGELEAVRRALVPLMTIAGDAGLEVRSHGLNAGCGRYAAFIDTGDVVYPEAYRLLIAELEATRAAVALGGILDAHVCRDGIVPFTTAKRRAVPSGGIENLRHNDAPLHSFVLDRQRIAPEHLAVHESWPGIREALRRICAHYPSSVRLDDKIVGERMVLAGLP